MQIQANVWHESELTSDWSSVAREFEELYSRGNDMNVSPTLGD
jgi:hypothetical protein